MNVLLGGDHTGKKQCTVIAQNDPGMTQREFPRTILNVCKIKDPDVNSLQQVLPLISAIKAVFS